MGAVARIGPASDEPGFPELPWLCDADWFSTRIRITVRLSETSFYPKVISM